MNLNKIKEPIISFQPNLEDVNDLNSYSAKEFYNPPRRNKGSRFRRHPFKDGNITVTLSNYDIEKNEKRVTKWKTSVQYGNGEGFPTFNYNDGFFEEIESLISDTEKGKYFLEVLNNGFIDKIGDGKLLQEMYEIQISKERFLEPTELVEEIGKIIDSLKIENKEFIQDSGAKVFKNKKAVPLKQVLALYAINKVTTIANQLWNNTKV